MKVAEYVAKFLSEHVTRVYAVCGAGAMHLNDAICHQPGLQVIAVHHEQAGAMAAEMDARVTGKMACLHVTTGPGGTNAVTGIAGAWVDSVPMLVIAGQVDSRTMINGSGTRQIGPNELDLVSIVKPITKFAATVLSEDSIRYTLERAVHAALSGRQGPVFIEIPLDIQAAEVNPDRLAGYTRTPYRYEGRKADVDQCRKLLQQADKPLILVGNGVHLAGAEAEFNELAQLGIPVVTAWGGTDLIATNHANYVGHVGLMGDRAGNFAVQNADVILAIGTRLSIPVIGHHRDLFAPNARLIVIDIDQNETVKNTIKPNLRIVADAKNFLQSLLSWPWEEEHPRSSWREQCKDWKHNYPVMQPLYRDTSHGINSYHFMEMLADCMQEDAIVVADVGVAVLSSMQSLKLNGKQRLLHSGGVSAMGAGLPGAIGAWYGGGGRQVISLNGDGGFMMNIQELQTVVHHKIPIKIFVFNNKGYLTMRFTQRTHFGREAIAGEESDLSCAEAFQVAEAFGLEASWIGPTDVDPEFEIKRVLNSNGPHLCQVDSPVDQLLMPRVKSRIEDGKFVPARLDDMWPHLHA